jgi:hypothetical protein
MLTTEFPTRRANCQWASIRLVLLLLLIAVAVVVAGCEETAQATVVFDAYNQTSHTASVSWQGPGGSGSGHIGPCNVAGTGYGLGPGTWQVTITEGANSKTFTITGPPTGMAYEYFAIRPDGQIEHLYRWLDLQSPPQTHQPPPSGC